MLRGCGMLEDLGISNETFSLSWAISCWRSPFQGTGYKQKDIIRFCPVIKGLLDPERVPKKTQIEHHRMLLRATIPLLATRDVPAQRNIVVRSCFVQEPTQRRTQSRRTKESDIRAPFPSVRRCLQSSFMSQCTSREYTPWYTDTTILSRCVTTMPQWTPSNSLGRSFGGLHRSRNSSDGRTVSESLSELFLDLYKPPKEQPMGQDRM
jgi:hypothetical protein